ncbi:MAG TPA: molybdopterin-dependent oxidoreductase [Candidatus Limnocylindrales bacterium]|nr:molybdopterin-dependent oxidoreductase [Candidatus Limnocylindrales bacterium]
MNAAPSGRWSAFAGAVAVGAALAIGELAAGVFEGIPSPLLAVARFLVDIQPPGAKDVVVALFGTNDKLAFQVLIVLISLLVGVLIGRLAVRRPDAAALVIVGFAAAGFAASLREPAVQPTLTLAAAAAEAVAGAMILQRLIRLVPAAIDARDAAARVGKGPKDAKASKAVDAVDWRRRALLRSGGAIAVGSVAVATLGRYLLQRQQVPPPSTAESVVPAKPADLPTGADIATADLSAAGLTPIVMPNEDFYRIDTAFVVPTVDRSTWRLKVTGLVDREVELTYDELVALPIIEQYVTIACVSNEVGGNLVGNAKWTGVALRDVLDMAGVQAGADQLVGHSVDGFTAGMPVEWVMDASRIPMIAVEMNGEPLPRAHGYPARLIVPGLYGYVSATKWLAELELTTFDAFQAFWVPRGWAAKAPILTQSRIDVPRFNQHVAAGHTPIAGVAWAPDRGIAKVEIRIDEGDWAPATTSAAISRSTWVQWLYDWDATPGDHVIEVRATDGTGEVQTDQVTPPPPDGARGHHRVSVVVS